MRVILRRPLAGHPGKDFEVVIATIGHGRVVHQDGRNVLADVAEDTLDSVKAALRGWGVYPQGPRIQVPDTRRKVLAGHR